LANDNKKIAKETARKKEWAEEAAKYLEKHDNG